MVKTRTATWLPVALAVGLAVTAAAMPGGLDRLWGSSQTDDLPPTVTAEFGRCHEGGGTNCVVDGDTVWIAGSKVRIAGIDAPETHEFKCAQEASLGNAAADRLQAMLNSGPVTIGRGARDRDPNGRLLRNLSVGGRDVGETLVALGLARRYGGAKKPWC